MSKKIKISTFLASAGVLATSMSFVASNCSSKTEPKQNLEIENAKKYLLETVASAKSLKENFKAKYPGTDLNKLETLITKTEDKVKETNITTEDIKSLKSELENQIKATKIDFAKNELLLEISVAEEKNSNVLGEKFLIKIKQALTDSIKQAKEVSEKNDQEESSYKNAQTKLNVAVKTFEKDVEIVLNAKKSIDEISKKIDKHGEDNKDKKAIKKVIDQFMNEFITKKENHELKDVENLSAEEVKAKLTSLNNFLIEELKTLETKIEKAKKDYERDLDFWRSSLRSVEEFEAKISKHTEKDKFMNVYKSIPEYNRFMDKTTIENYNGEELGKTITEINKKLLEAHTMYIKSQLEEFKKFGEQKSDVTYKTIKFEWATSEIDKYSKTYEQLVKFIDDYIDSIAGFSKLLDEVDKQLDAYKKKLNI
ncbi:hypothetical protein NPA07_02695 [Mycoplasmopsis caviae]|uniref:Lipoprotein n=1 Tax=Mycoplasmopsis caviae TaxID=55603 RepID=A0A3P8KNE3_9BACT|nr:hypothetical protein [Mycoplasmopsis caviae]UUD35758.1 hypothetical protein NPA07_02695 [Mycoplasmopsis caviae]VDR42408.1 Uncharacterised protein [Mycoplasmopsis caviae]